MADRIAIMNDGQLQQVASPEETFNAPVNTFVADFIGSPTINLFEASVSTRDDEYAFETGSMRFEVPTDLVDAPIDADSVTVGFRPQDLYQVGDDDGTLATIETDVRVVEPLGTEAVVHTEVDDREVTAKIDDFAHIDRGTTITLGIDPRHVYLFDAETGGLLKPRIVGDADSSDSGSA